MRCEKERIRLLKEGGADPQDIRDAKVRLNAKIDEYANFADKMNLKQQRERIHVGDESFRIGKRQLKNENRQQYFRITSKHILDYEELKDLLGGGDNDPVDVEEYARMMYTKSTRCNLFQDYAKSRKNNMISSFTSFKQYVEYKERIEKEIVGLTTSNGIVIKSQSKYFIERVFGTTEDPKTKRPRSGIDLEDIIDALLNGYIRQNKEDSIQFKTKKCSVSVNLKMGN